MNLSAPILDATTARIETVGERQRLAAWLDKAITAALLFFVAAVPHSIAGAQVAWSVALLAWSVRLFVRPRPSLHRTPLDYLLLGFFVLTGIAAFASYAPDISVGKLRAASLFTIVYLVAQNVRDVRTLRRLVLVLLASTAIGIVFTFAERAVGRGIAVRGLAAASPLLPLGVQEGDTLLSIDGKALASLDQLDVALQLARDEGRAPWLRFYHVEAYLETEARDVRLLDGASAGERLGVGEARRGRDWRAAGFYGHYTTFAEVLQLIIALALGLLFAHAAACGWRTRRGLLLLLFVLGAGGALLLTVTRASWLACLVASAVILAVGARSRKVLAVGVLVALLLTPAALYVLQQKRSVGFLDRRDNSTTWRMTVYREGVELLLSEPRHILFGVGMDSIKRFRNQWGLFDRGRLPPGHFHSTPLQLAVERGLLTLFLWLALLFVYGRMLWRLWQSKALRTKERWLERGLALGALGGLAGFFTSGLVHYNLGDSEVAMVFYFITGCTLAVEKLARGAAAMDASGEA